MIVLIDDDEIQNLINGKVISIVNASIEVKAFTSAEKALNALTTSDLSPKLLFLDINMPKMNGWDFLDAYSKEEVQIPVYMLSSSINDKDIKRAEGYQIVRSFISKPLVMKRLQDILAENNMM